MNTPLLRRAMAGIPRAAGRVWALPNTIAGLLCGLFVVGLGGRARLRAGALEFSGAPVRRFVDFLPRSCRFSAITLGHVILGISEEWLDALRDHEQVHVRQYERWGLLFLPAYLASSLWQVARGRSAYRDNYFERQAFAAERTSARPPHAGEQL